MRGVLVDLDGAEKAVLLVLAAHADEAGLCWPSVPRLVDVLGYSERSIRRAVAALRRRGLIVNVGRAPGPAHLPPQYRSVLWRLSLPGVPQASGPEVPSVAPLDLSPMAGQTAAGVPPASGPEVPPVAARGDTGGTQKNQGSTKGKNQSRREPVSPDVLQLCDMLADSIGERGSKRPTVTDAWLNDMDRLCRLDGRSPDDVARVIRWLTTGDDDVAQFWAPNIRSPRKLRDRWDHMREQYDRSKARPNGNGHRPTSAAAATEIASRVMGLR